MYMVYEQIEGRVLLTNKIAGRGREAANRITGREDNKHSMKIAG